WAPGWSRPAPPDEWPGGAPPGRRKWVPRRTAPRSARPNATSGAGVAGRRTPSADGTGTAALAVVARPRAPGHFSTGQGGTARAVLLGSCGLPSVGIDQESRLFPGSGHAWPHALRGLQIPPASLAWRKPFRRPFKAAR